MLGCVRHLVYLGIDGAASAAVQDIFGFTIETQGKERASDTNESGSGNYASLNLLHEVKGSIEAWRPQRSARDSEQRHSVVRSVDLASHAKTLAKVRSLDLTSHE